MILMKRYKVGVSTSVKGVIKPDLTVEITAEFENGEYAIDLKPLVLQEVVSLETELAVRYPVINTVINKEGI
jgi:hypothetical protein|tara:strand:+ start:202 stop:417 length:216 start_codon:yes stop_codon:yes gene_type:complete